MFLIALKNCPWALGRRVARRAKMRMLRRMVAGCAASKDCFGWEVCVLRQGDGCARECEGQCEAPPHTESSSAIGPEDQLGRQVDQQLAQSA